MRQTGASPRLVIRGPEKLRGLALTIAAGRQILGRAPGADLQIADGYVSRTHAALESVRGQTVVEDLGSSGGTLVNGVPLRGRRRLNHGDLLRFGAVEARYEEPGHNMDAARPLVSREPAAPPPVRGATAFHVGHQEAGQLNNVARDQYIQNIQAERDSFVREIAAARTRASRLIVVGFVLFLAGIGTTLWVMSRTVSGVDDAFSAFPGHLPAVPRDPTDRPTDPALVMPTDPGVQPIFDGIQSLLVAEGVLYLGSALMLVGLVLHIIAAARRRSFDGRNRHPRQNVPPPPTW